MPDSQPQKTQLDRIEESLGVLHDCIDGLVTRIEKIEKRLTEGDSEFRELKWDIGICNSAVRALCIHAGANEQAAKITDRMSQRFGSGTMSGLNPHRDEKTDPGGDG